MEITRGYGWIYDRLTTDAGLTALATGGVHRGAVPRNANPGPAVVMAYMGDGEDVYVSNTGVNRLMTRATYLVKAVMDGDSEVDAEPIADRIDALLNGKRGGAVNSCVRKRPFSGPDESDPNHPVAQVGGFYRLEIMA